MIKRNLLIPATLCVMGLALSACGAKNVSKNLSDANTCLTNFAMEANNEEIEYVSNEFGEQSNLFAYDLYSELYTGENLFFSPYSLTSAMSMLDNAADEKTKSQIETALHMYDLDTRNNDYRFIINSFKESSSTFNTSNSVWISKQLELEDDAKDIFFIPLKKYYDADAYSEDFSSNQAVTDINTWINDATQGMIPSMLDELDDETAMCLINAVYFKGQWTTPFEEENTEKKSFYGLNETTTQDIMCQYDTRFKYIELNGLKGIELPYDDGNIAMDIWICDDNHLNENGSGDVNAIVLQLSDDERAELFGALDLASYEDFSTVQLPKFSLETDTFSVKNQLVNLGITEAFDEENANFDYVNEDLYLSDVLHKAKIEVNESGSEAAAATVAIMDCETAVPFEEEPEIKTFVADKPFIFCIKDTETGTILFMGTVNDLK